MNWRFVLHRAGTRVRHLGTKNSTPQKIRGFIKEPQQQQKINTFSRVKVIIGTRRAYNMDVGTTRI